jgi:hypothetical protein
LKLSIHIGDVLDSEEYDDDIEDDDYEKEGSECGAVWDYPGSPYSSEDEGI